MKKNLNANSKRIAGTYGAPAISSNEILKFYEDKLDYAWEHRDPDTIEAYASYFEQGREQNPERFEVWDSLLDTADYLLQLYYMLY